MVLTSELIDAISETLEGLPLLKEGAPLAEVREAAILVFHPRERETASTSMPLLEITLVESGHRTSLIVQSALGMIEFRDVTEIRLLESTREAAFFCRAAEGCVNMLTLSSHGVVQLYVNVASELLDREFSELADEDLGAAVALKVFHEQGKLFSTVS